MQFLWPPNRGDYGHARHLHLVSILTARTVHTGTVIIRKGEPGDAMYFIRWRAAPTR